MEYPQVTSLVPENENFDSTAVNEAVLISQGHLAAIETALENNAAAVQTLNDQLTAATTARDEASTARDTAVTAQQTAEQTLATANTTIAERDEQITQLNARVAQLEASTPPPQQTNTQADKTGQDKVPFHQSKDNPGNQMMSELFGVKFEEQ